MMIGTVLVAALVVASPAADPQSAGPRPAARADIEVTVQPLFEGRATPFVGIFPQRPSQPDRSQDRVQGTPVETRPKTRIVCGMVVIEGDPKIDPKIFWGDRGVTVVNPDPKMSIPHPPCPEHKR